MIVTVFLHTGPPQPWLTIKQRVPIIICNIFICWCCPQLTLRYFYIKHVNQSAHDDSRTGELFLKCVSRKGSQGFLQAREVWGGLLQVFFWGWGTTVDRISKKIGSGESSNFGLETPPPKKKRLLGNPDQYKDEGILDCTCSTRSKPTNG